MQTRTRPPRLRIQPRRPRGRPKTEDLQALEARLVLAARQVFAAYGYGAASINNIAKLARVSKNTLYARFRSKADLLRAIVERQVDRAQQALRPALGRPEQKLEKRLCDYINVGLKRSLDAEVLEINRLVASESTRFPELGDAVRLRFKTGVKQVAQIIKEAAGRDRIRCRDPEAAAESLLTMANGYYLMVMITNRAISDREQNSWVEQAVRTFIAGRPGW
jgi:TetR/AcrR family transcriptional regulator, mexJK operon transcriptional repressor